MSRLDVGLIDILIMIAGGTRIRNKEGYTEVSGGGGGDMRRFRFFPSFILTFFWGSPLEKGEEFKTVRSIFRMHWYSRNVLLEIRVMLLCARPAQIFIKLKQNRIIEYS